MIVRSLIVADRPPIASFRRRERVRIFLDHLTIESFGVGPPLLLKSNPRQGHCKLRRELVLRQVALDPVPLSALGVEDQNRRGPGRIEAMKPGGMLFDVSLDGEKIRVDKGCDTLVRVRLGFQPSTSPSSRSRAEIQ